MAGFSDVDGNGREIKFYDADEDGTLDKIGKRDPWSQREAVLKRVDKLDKDARLRIATSAEVEEKMKALLGRKVEILADDIQVSGIVVAIERIENQVALLKVVEGHHTGSDDVATDVKVENFFEVPQLPH